MLSEPIARRTLLIVRAQRLTPALLDVKSSTSREVVSRYHRYDAWSRVCRYQRIPLFEFVCLSGTILARRQEDDQLRSAVASLSEVLWYTIRASCRRQLAVGHCEHSTGVMLNASSFDQADLISEGGPGDEGLVNHESG